MTIPHMSAQSITQGGVQDGSVWGELLFTFSDSELDHDPDTYLQLQTPHRERPKKPIWKQLHSLRPELESLGSCSDQDQLDVARAKLAQRGFAALTHHSKVLEESALETQYDYSLFVLENQDDAKPFSHSIPPRLMKKITGADEVIVWNTVKRDSTASLSASLSDDYERQRTPQGIESRFDKPLEPPALFAHIDQDPSYGTAVCSMAIAATPWLLTQPLSPIHPLKAIEINLAKNYSRTMIINLWRPVGGKVYDKPLAVADFRSLDKNSLSRHANPFGCGYDVHDHDGQRWHFIPHQTNDEVLVFKCYDSLSLQQQQEQQQEEQEDSDEKHQVEALYGAHCAVTRLKGAYPIPPPNAPPRKSVEFRFVAVWR
ncbi:uncharacterized protein UTRI_05381 [Ustilago trichophora]|uniref:GA4 desaturase n=1 Tax=Ustilago trichophora TaxID=86804 RepID=A0A5C3EJE0_9BASI|nr:uncharacterized protein UTRI_05381 [Ustilago trichophora]